MSTQHSTAKLPVEFPQPYSGHLIDQLLSIVSQAVATATLPGCCYEGEALTCYKPATVHHLALEQDFCARHFRAVERG